MKISWLVPALFALLAGCGQDKTYAVYDTDNNPDKFPPAAVEVIRGIQAGSLRGADSIMVAFSDLLTAHGELLDRPEWRKAVDNLGGLFRNLGDSLARQGVDAYSSAADYYQLASLARPEDTAAKRLSGVFGAWQAERRSSGLSPAALVGDVTDFDALLDLTRRFMFGDTLAQAFFRDYLGPEIRKDPRSHGLFTPDSLAGRPRADRALLVCAGLADAAGLDKLATFTPPRIDLIAARVTQLDSASYRAEVYLVPRETVPTPLKLYVRFDSDAKTAWPAEIIPGQLATSWKPGQLVLLTRAFSYSESLAWAGIGLSDFATPRGNFLRMEDGGRELYRLADTDLVLK